MGGRASTYEAGDRVRDRKWDGTYVGTVLRVGDGGDLFVKWDGHWVECQMSPDEVELAGET
jgi:hypothetical protein